MRLIEWLAALFGIAGSALLAVNVDPAFGFGAFLVSNVGWIAIALRRGMRGLLVQTLAFMVTSLIGLWNFWLGPVLLG